MTIEKQYEFELGDFVNLKADPSCTGILVAIPWSKKALSGFESFVYDQMIEQMGGDLGVYLYTLDLGLSYVDTPNKWDDLLRVPKTTEIWEEFLRIALLGLNAKDSNSK